MHSLKIIVAALTLSFAAPCFAAGETPVAPPSPRQMTQKGSEDMLGRAVYQSLVGEFALRRGDLELATSAWADLAVRTRDPQVFARAIEVLGFAKKFDTAIDLANLWLKSEPDSAKAKQLQSSLMVMTNQLDELAPQISNLLAQDTATLPLNLLQLNRLLARHTDKKAVFKLVERVVAPYLGMPEAHFSLAQAANAAGDEMRALTEIEKALQLRPDWEAAALVRGQLQARHNAVTAINGLNEFVQRSPQANDVRLMLARLLINQKRFDEARTQFDLLIKAVPDSPQVIYPLAMLALQQGDAAVGRKHLEHLLETDFPDKNTLHFFLGQIDEETRQFDSALTQYLQVTGGDQFVAARTRAALILQKQGKFDAARESISSARGSNEGERTQLLLAESQLLREVGRNEEAYALLENNLLKQPENTELLYEAALLAERQGKPEILEKHLKRLLEIKPEHAHALNALAYSWAERNIRLAEAEQLIARALRAAPDDAFIMDSLGWVFYRQGRLNEALKTLERAYSLKNDGEIAAHIGQVLWALERKDEARRVLLAAAKRHPENEALAAIIKKLLP